jgi:hypothetical protein
LRPEKPGSAGKTDEKTKSILGIINSANDWVPPETKEMLDRQSARQMQIEKGMHLISTF